MRLFEGLLHPVEGRKKCVCGKCFDKIEASEAKYCFFVMNAFKNRKMSLKKRKIEEIYPSNLNNLSKYLRQRGVFFNLWVKNYF